ncbi:MAG: DUF1045 domain-containing protein [Rhodospirillaceae bacterium]|nr:DUF1045 domain-containing protein [Rhodospirillaceae bacterium]
MAPRYAIYFAPEHHSPLEDFGRRWLGRNGVPADSPPPVVPGISPERFFALTESARRYGFHGTLKPPFELNPRSSREALFEAVRIFAKSAAPIELPPLELAIIGKFIALTPIRSSAVLENLAALCVRTFEGFRMPLSKEQMAHYLRNKLTVHQTQMLEHWGYPYVMEEFRFHISVTDRIDNDTERAAMMTSVQKMTVGVVNKPIVVRDVAVFYQADREQPMELLDRFPFGRSK